MKISRCCAVLVAAVSVGVVGAPTALADDDQYIAELQANGVPVFNRGLEISQGHFICTELQQGMTVSDISAQFTWFAGFGPAMAAAAVHNYCPGTPMR